MKKQIIFTLTLVSALAFAAIRGSLPANWWEEGSDVTFITNKPLSDDKAPVRVRVYSSAGDKILEETVSAEDFQNRGWQWKGPRGYYEVEFIQNGVLIGEKIQCPRGYSQPKIVSRHAFVIAPPKNGKKVEIGARISSSNRYNILLADILGISEILVSDINPQSTPKNNWKALDSFMEVAKQTGFGRDNIAMNIAGNYQSDAYADFLMTLTAKYPGVCNFYYSMQKNPDMPVSDQDWTADDYYEFFRMAQRLLMPTIDSNDYIGYFTNDNISLFDEYSAKFPMDTCDGIASRGDAFDNCRATYERVAASNAKTLGKFINADWQTKYISSNADAHPSERKLGRCLIINYLSLIRDKVDKIYIGNLVKPERTESDFADYYGGKPSIGFFSNLAYRQPRYGAFAWAVLKDAVGEKFTVKKEYVVGDNASTRYCVVCLADSDGRDALVVWNPHASDIFVSDKLLALCDNSTKCVSSDGKEIAIGQRTKLEKDMFYIFTGLKKFSKSAWQKYEYPALQYSNYIGENNPKYVGLYHEKPIFPDFELYAILYDSLDWTVMPNAVCSNPNANPAMTAGCFTSGIAKDGGFEIMVMLEDVTAGNAGDGKFDGKLEVAIDTEGKGYPSDILAFELVRDGNYNAVVTKTRAPYLSQILPPNYTKPGKVTGYASARIERSHGQTIYFLRIPASELKPMQILEGMTIKVGIVATVTDRDGNAHKLYWGACNGILDNPIYYGSLKLSDDSSMTVMNQYDLKMTTPQDADFQIVSTFDADGDYLRATPSDTCAEIATEKRISTHEENYNITFKARGNGYVEVWNNSFGEAPRQLFETDDLVEDEWKTFTFRYSPPYKSVKNVENKYQLPDWGLIFKMPNQPMRHFDIKDFVVTKYSDIRK